jgi:hypothetical protein
MLQYLLAVDEVEALVSKRDNNAVECLKASIGTRRRFMGVSDVQTHPLHTGVPVAKEVKRAPRPAAQIQHPPGASRRTSNLTLDVVLSEYLSRMIRWHRSPQQLLKLSAGQPHERIVGDDTKSRPKVPSTQGAFFTQARSEASPPR